jgi:glycosyltransferase involved in cell wall biosynthesis
MADAVRNIRRHVLIIEPAGQLWGSERALLDLISHLSGERWRVTVALPPDTPFEPLLARLPVEIVTGPIGGLHLRGPVSRAVAAVWLSRLVLLKRPDVIHVNQAGLARLAGFAGLVGRAPVVSHVRLHEDAVRLNERQSKNSRGSFVAISKFIHETLISGDESPSRNVRFIYDPFDINSFPKEQLDDARRAVRSEFGLGDDTPLVTLVGRICREKGQDLFVKAAGLVGCTDAHFLIAGSEPSGSVVEREFADSVRAMANVPPLVDRVHFLGERSDVGRLLSASDVAVLASRGEPFGRVLLEALALGTPVVGPNYGGPVEIIGPDERGLGFESEDPASLAKAIDWTLSNQVVARERARRGGEWVGRVCAPEKHAEAIESFWNDAIVR